MGCRLFSRIKFQPWGTGEPIPAGRLTWTPWMRAAAVWWLPSQLGWWMSPRAKLPAALAPRPERTVRFKFEVFAPLTLFNRNKSRSSSSLPVGRGDSSWREEERKTFGFELLLGRFAQAGTAVIACCDSRLLQPGGVRAGLAAAGRISEQVHRSRAGSFVLTNLNHRGNSSRWKHIDARRQSHLNQAFDVHSQPLSFPSALGSGPLPL